MSIGTCARAFGTPCIHEHACVRCSMLWPDPAQRARLVEIRDNLVARIEEAEREGWLGEVEGLQVSLAGAEDKLAQIDRQMGSLSIELDKARDSAPKGRTSLIHPASPADHERPEVNPLPAAHVVQRTRGSHGAASALTSAGCRRADRGADPNATAPRGGTSRRTALGRAVDAHAGSLFAPDLSSFTTVGKVDEALAGEEVLLHIGDDSFHSWLGPRRQLRRIPELNDKQSG